LPPWDAAWAPFVYGWPLDRLEARFKFGGDLACGRSLAKLWRDTPLPLDRPELILPVPLHRQRLRERGYNQALELARPLARALSVPLRHDVLLRNRASAPQTELDARTRRRNVYKAFVLKPVEILPAHVVIDVMTTGATLAECARTVKRAGVVRVDVWALARAPARHS
jgi:ComF family protein